MINFSICEQSGRTFELSLEDLEAIFNTCTGRDIEFDNEEERVSEMIRVIIGELGFDELAEHEKDNNFYDLTLENVEIDRK